MSLIIEASSFSISSRSKSLFNRLCISIVDSDNASNSLNRICKYEGQLSEESIKNALLLLKDVLDKNDFNMYFHKDGKLYRKNSKGIKRVKDIRELING